MPKLEASIDQKLLAPLGRVAANFAMLEMQMAIAIRFLLFWDPGPTDNASYIVTSELRFKDKIALLSALYQFRFPERGPTFSTLRALTRRLTDANKQRNSLLHSSWAAGKEEGTSTRITFRAREHKGFESIFDKVTLEQIKGTGDFIGEVAYEVQQLWINGKKKL